MELVKARNRRNALLWRQKWENKLHYDGVDDIKILGNFNFQCNAISLLEDLKTETAMIDDDD